jgi:hypothetical protein
LPADPGQLTPYDMADLVGRLNACEASAAPSPPASPATTPDAGAP